MSFQLCQICCCEAICRWITKKLNQKKLTFLSPFALFHQCCRYVEVRKKVTSCFGSIGSFINDNERNGICLKVGLTTTSEWGSSSASSAFCWLPALLPPSRRAFLLAAAASSAWSCFLFFWLPDYAVSGQIWITSMLVIAVTLRISCRLKGCRHLKLCSIPGLPRKSEKLS